MIASSYLRNERIAALLWTDTEEGEWQGLTEGLKVFDGHKLGLSS